jgi:hypothetical protein
VTDGIPRLVISGKLPRKNVPWDFAKDRFEIGEDRYILPIGFDPSPYLDRALQGATIVPRAAWFVRIANPENGAIVDVDQPYVETDEHIEKKKPWDKLHLEGEVESRFLFGTVLGSDVVPFAIERIRPVILPILTQRGEKKKLVLLDSTAALRNGFAALASWLKNVEKSWSGLKKKGTKLTIYERLDFHQTLTSQAPKARHRVIFTAAGTNLVASIIPDSALSSEVGHISLSGFIVEHKFYTIIASSSDEAHYLAAVLNSPLVDSEIKPYQTVGLFGARDIERRALEILPIPLFDASHPVHKELAELGRVAENGAHTLLPTLKTLRTGKKRVLVRQALKHILNTIDADVRKLVTLKAKEKHDYKVIQGQTRLEF